MPSTRYMYAFVNLTHVCYLSITYIDRGMCADVSCITKSLNIYFDDEVVRILSIKHTCYKKPQCHCVRKLVKKFAAGYHKFNYTFSLFGFSFLFYIHVPKTLK